MRCAARGRAPLPGPRAVRAPPRSPRARRAARRRPGSQPAAVAIEHRKRQPAQAELVAGRLLLAVAVGERDRPRLASAGRKAQQLAGRLLGRQPERRHDGVAVRLGRTSMAAADSPSPVADSSTRRSARPRSSRRHRPRAGCEASGARSAPGSMPLARAGPPPRPARSRAGSARPRPRPGAGGRQARSKGSAGVPPARTRRRRSTSWSPR